MKELVCIIIGIIISFSELKVNNEVIIESSIQQVENVELGTFFILKNDTKFIYREKDRDSLNLVLDYWNDLPIKVKQGVKEIQFEDKKGDVAGVTKGTSITLYDFSAYDISTQRHILYHEIGHTFANELERLNKLDFDEYIVAAKIDKNYLSNYSKNKIRENNNYSEDFADAFSMYFRECDSFKRKHKNRYKYLDDLINGGI
ncbi:MAG: hypothetical protein J6B87_05585 [Clostridia bacterium]|nr:hypothetical protein [Clostridia bacterium]